MREVQDEQVRTAEQVFGARVRELRDAMKITQNGLSFRVEVMTGHAGNRIKMDPSAIARLEKGERSIRLNEASALSAALDMSVDEMLRKALPPEEQIRQAEEQLERAHWRAAQAEAEHHVAKARLERLRTRLGGGDGGEHRETA